MPVASPMQYGLGGGRWRGTVNEEAKGNRPGRRQTGLSVSVSEVTTGYAECSGTGSEDFSHLHWEVPGPELSPNKMGSPG